MKTQNKYHSMIDVRGYRLNVGVILLNNEKKIFFGKCVGRKNAWQFPQGGINAYETLQEAMYRELTEEIGLTENDVKILSITKRWLYYNIPKHFQRKNTDGKNIRHCIGQKQKWFLLQLTSDPNKIRFDYTDSPEFIEYSWVDYWNPIECVVRFKRNVYTKVLHEFSRIIINDKLSAF